MASLLTLWVVTVGLLLSLCRAQNKNELILMEIQKLTDAISNQKMELVSAFEELKEELTQGVGDKLNEVKAEWYTINNNTKNDVATLQHLLDTDECYNLSHNCSTDASCVDTTVSFKCTCKSGYSGDGYACEDIDECADGNRCRPHEKCTNSIGSYTCGCSDGFIGNGYTCEDVDECSNGTHNCHRYAVCTNTVGSYTCACALFTEGDGIQCRETDRMKCKEPFKPVVGVGCLHIIERSQSFVRGQESCQEVGGDLFVAINPDHYLRLAQHFIDTDQAARKKYMYVGVKEGTWLSGRKVDPQEEADGNPSMGSGTCSYTDGDRAEGFLLWTDPCSDDWWALCEMKI